MPAMSGTPANNPVKVITAKRAHDALAHFEENLGRNLRILRDEPVNTASELQLVPYARMLNPLSSGRQER